MSDLVKRLREILENATPGPWVACKDSPDEGPEDVVMAGNRYIASCHEGLRERAEGNAALIAWAPDIAAELIVKSELIGALVEEIARLARENETLRAQLHEGRQRQWIAAYRENDELKAELTSLREQMKDREYD